MTLLATIPLLDASTWLHALGPWVLVGIGVFVFIESGVLTTERPEYAHTFFLREAWPGQSS